MKKIILLIIALPALVYTAKAQLGYNYKQYSLGFGYAYNTATTDVPYQASYSAFNFNASYNYTPFTSFTLEYEFGKLSGGSGHFTAQYIRPLDPNAANYTQEVTQLLQQYAAVDPFNRDYHNQYQSVILHGDVQFGEFLDYSSGNFFAKALKNVYVGTGIGLVYNNITSINRFSADSSYIYGGSNHSTNVLIPARVGFQVKVYDHYNEPFIVLDVGYQMNYVFGYGLDGYSDPTFTKRSYEQYGGFKAGLKFNIGDYTSYRKEIRN